MFNRAKLFASSTNLLGLPALIFSLVLAATFTASNSANATLGEMGFSYQIRGVSATGTQLGGTSTWDEETMMSTVVIPSGVANGMSNEGIYITGGTSGEAFYWDGSLNMIGFIPGETSSGGHATQRMKSGGLESVIVVGDSGPNKAFWYPDDTTSPTPMELPPLAGQSPAHTAASARDVFVQDSNTAIVVGFSKVSGNDATLRALSWTVTRLSCCTFSTSAATALHGPGSAAQAISRDGKAILGTVSGVGGAMWINGNMTSITGMSTAVAASDSGFVAAPWVASPAAGHLVVGNVGGVAKIWDSTNGTRDLKTVLTSFGFDLSDWTSFEVLDISADGLTLVGKGSKTDGSIGWRVAVGRSMARTGTDNQLVDPQFYRIFKTRVDGWNFQNNQNNMWPTSGSSSQCYNYSSNNNPCTGGSYMWTETCPRPTSDCLYPTFPLLFNAFGTAQVCQPGPVRNRLLGDWKRWRAPWGGSCSGFAKTSSMAFDQRANFRAEFSGVLGATEEVNNAALDNTIRTAINEAALFQWGTASGFGGNPTQVTAELIKEYEKKDQDNRNLAMTIQNSNNTAIGHEVVPHRVVQMTDTTKRIYIYDNNFPSMDNQFVDIDETANSWTYSGFRPNAGATPQSRTGTIGLSLTPKMSTQFQFPAGKQARRSARGKVGEEIEILLRHAGDAIVTTASGDSVGVVDSLLVKNSLDAEPIILLTGYESLPVGYRFSNQAPGSSYQISLSEYQGSEIDLTGGAGTTSFGFSRFEAEPSHEDHLEITPDGGITYSTMDGASKLVDLSGLVETGGTTREFSFESVAVQASGVYELAKEGADEISLVSNTATSYRLFVREESGSGEDIFRAPPIQVAANSKHIIAPVWGDLVNQQTEISIDLGNDGSIDQTVMVSHDPATNVDDLPGSGRRYTLAQNHPNPFNPKTEISFTLTQPTRVTLEVFDARGRSVDLLVEDELRPAGIHRLAFDATDLASGIYFYQLRSDSFSETKRMALIK